MATSTIAKISKRAKAIRKAQPNKAWQSCIKQASKELKSTNKKKVGAVAGKKYKTVPRKFKIEGEIVRKGAAPKKKSAPRRLTQLGPERLNGVGSVKGTTPKAVLLNETKNALGKLYVQRDMATTKRDKKAIGKKISEKKSKLRLISKL